jgi:copper transport protein
LVATGVFSSLVELPTLASLWETSYGRVLFLKLGLVLLVLLLAFLNRRLIHHRPPLLESQTELRRFNRQVGLEVVLALGVMLVVAVLVQTTPARAIVSGVQASQPSRFEEVVKADDLTIHTQVYPTQAGDNNFQVHLYHEDGSTIGQVQQVRLFFNYQEKTLGQTRVDLKESSPNIFTGDGAYLSQGGTWSLSVYVRRRGLDDVLAEVTLEIPFPPGSAGQANPWANPVPNLPPELLVARAVMAGGGAAWLWRRLQNKAALHDARSQTPVWEREA